MVGALIRVVRCWRGRLPGRRLYRYAWTTIALLMLTAMPAPAAEFALAPGRNVVGDFQRHIARRGDVFPDLARHYDLGYTALVTANPGVDPWAPGAGRRVTIPSMYVLPDAPHQGIVINLGQWRIFYFPPGGGRVVTYPIGIGVIGWKTPLGTTRVVRKEPNPAWYPPASIRAEHHAEGDDLPAVVPAGPDNPLGAFALHLGWPRYLVHGTNKPDGVGRNVSHGCIRLFPDDIAQLFSLVAVGAPVRVVNQPATVGWAGNSLYLQIYPSHAQADEIDVERAPTPDPVEGVRSLVRAAAGEWADAVDWTAVDGAASARTGMPVKIAEKSAIAEDAPPASGDVTARDDGGSAVSVDVRPQESFARLLQSLTRADEPDDRAAAPNSDLEAVEPYVAAPPGRDSPMPIDPFRRAGER